MNTDPTYRKNYVNVRRSHCWKDALTKLSHPGFIPERQLSVKFADTIGASEGAVDEGGPTREFLRLSVKDMFCTSGMFNGDDRQMGLVLNSEGNIYQQIT